MDQSTTVAVQLSQITARGLVEHADGVHFGLAHNAYLEDWALGAGAIKTLKSAPPEWYWESPLNTLVTPEPDSPEKQRWRIVGTAAHVCLLESFKLYEMAYGVRPSARDYLDHIYGGEALKAECRRLHIPARGTNEAMAREIRKVDPDAKILLAVQEEWDALGKRPLTRKEDITIRLLHQMAQRSAEEIELAGGERVSLRDAFSGGLSELSVFWTDENGIRQRARFDKLKINAIIDLKTIGKPLRNFREALLYEIANLGYMYQVAHYIEARRQLARLIAEGKVFGGSPKQRAYLEECAANDDFAWVFVFGKVAGAPQLKGIRLDEHDTVVINAKRDREEALANFLMYREIFGLEPDKIWFDTEVIWKPEDSDWPMFAGLER